MPARISLIAISAALSLPLQNAALAQPAQGYVPGAHMWEGGWHGWFMAPFMMILFVAIAAAVVVLVVRWIGGPAHRHGNPQGGGAKTPHDILDERFARGEIDSAEYRERQGVLRE